MGEEEREKEGRGGRRGDAMAQFSGVIQTCGGSLLLGGTSEGVVKSSGSSSALE